MCGRLFYVTLMFVIRENIQDLEMIKHNLQTKLLRTDQQLHTSYLLCSHPQVEEIPTLADNSIGRPTALYPNCTISPGVNLHSTAVEPSPHPTGACNLRSNDIPHTTALMVSEEDTYTGSLFALSAVTVNNDSQCSNSDSSSSSGKSICSELSSLTGFNEKDQHSTASEVKVKRECGMSGTAGDDKSSLFNKNTQHHPVSTPLHDLSPQHHDILQCDSSFSQQLSNNMPSRNRESPQYLDSFLQTSTQHSSYSHHQDTPEKQDTPSCQDALQLQDSPNSTQQQDTISHHQDTTLTYISSLAITHTPRQVLL